MNQDQLESACAFWAVEYAMNDLQYERLPTPPVELLKWGKFDKKSSVDESIQSRMREMSAGFWGEHQKKFNQNRTSLWYLKYLAKHMARHGATERLAKVEERIKEFTSRGVIPWDSGL